MSMDNDFDTQINNAFHGVGKPVTNEAMLLMATFNRLARDTYFECVNAWQEGNMLWACIREYEPAGTIVGGVQGTAIASDYTQAARRMIDHCINPPLSMPKGE